MQRIKNLLWSSVPAEFESVFALRESVERLSAATRRLGIVTLTRQEAVGTVKELQVSLQRAIPMEGNSFKPFFRGRFIERNGKVILAGRFTMHPYVKAFMTFWFGVVGCLTLLIFLHSRTTIAPLGGVGMIVAGIAMVMAGRWFARNDAAWLSEAICSALHAQVLVHPEHTQT